MPEKNQDKMITLTKKTSDMLKLLTVLSKSIRKIERYITLKNNA